MASLPNGQAIVNSFQFFHIEQLGVANKFHFY